ncbi:MULTISPECIES: hypothetical protein [unclassified Lentimicrobium]|uniref:hypothetical protein n=1 Tax=unclassified Lentimicrobium TaxID=2677434 RepID=UPI0015564BD4|nr:MULTISPECIES: hypothetical protein [unclassified Lentimicrobium]NPD46821.1 hypothetical protein [Lentimicrobium sp. S6]NPD87031.1 hypothetical protein [Lentimicrobium sp. L6]
MDFFLRAKHWQIFTLLIIIPVSLQIFLLAIDDLDLLLVISPAFVILYIVIFFGWLWAVGTKLHHKLPAKRRPNLMLFKVILLVPIIYILGISIYLSMVIMGSVPSDSPSLFIMNDIIREVFPLHMLSMFCLFYTFWNNAKTIKSIELQRPVTFSDFSEEFFLMWFFPIGIWVIQPRVNKMME